MKIVTIPVGLLDTNCYLVFLEEKKQLYIIDPGADASEIATAARRFPFEHCMVLLTHAHVDHISGLGELAGLLPVDSVYLSSPDETLYNSSENALEPYLPAARDLPETAGRTDSPDFKIIPLPGHTPGGCAFLFPGPPAALFAGDSVFAGSIGRTDLPGGNYDRLMQSLSRGFLTLPEELAVYPGHGPATTVGHEKRTNPYLQDL